MKTNPPPFGHTAPIPSDVPQSSTGRRPPVRSPRRDEANDPSTIAFINLADVEPETITWLWPNKIPLGKLTLLEGDPDNGKTMVALDILARITTGRPMPGEATAALPPSNVVVLSAEDGLADTIVPRLIAAGADLSRITALPMGTLPDLDGEGRDRIEAEIRRREAVAILFDPLVAFIPDKSDSKSDQHMRRVLTPIAALGESTGSTPLAIRHLNKSSSVTNAKHRGGGSIGITGAARAVILIGIDPHNPERHIFARTKCNVGAKWPSLAYELRVEPGKEWPCVRWLSGTSCLTADDLLAARDSPEERYAVGEAIAFLKDYLGSGPVGSKAVNQAARLLGISARTLTRARERLSVRAVPPSRFGGEWSMRLPETFAPDAHGDKPDDESKTVPHPSAPSPDTLFPAPSCVHPEACSADISIATNSEHCPSQAGGRVAKERRAFGERSGETIADPEEHSTAVATRAVLARATDSRGPGSLV